jgi:basic amino acid/polyamine antiporter, APA family
MKPTLGLTGLTMNAMALIAPGAFLWLTFRHPGHHRRHRPPCGSASSRPAAVPGHRGLLRGNGQAVSRHRQFVLLRGTVVSQPRQGVAYARLSKFIVGWGSHLYYWIYPGVMVGVMGILCGYLVGTLWPNFMSASNPGHVVHDGGRAVVFSFASPTSPPRRERLDGGQHRHQRDSDQRAGGLRGDGARLPHEPSAGTPGWQFDSTSGDAYTTSSPPRSSGGGPPRRHHRARRNGVPQAEAGRGRQAGAVHGQLSREGRQGQLPAIPTPGSVVGMHNFGWVFVQATVAILILVGFESVTSMGGEAKNAKRDVPIAVIVSLLVQGAVLLPVRVFRGELLPQ